MPASFGEKLQMAKVLASSGLIPSGLNSPEKVCVALQWGHELQLSPMVAVNNIAVINGKPTLSADIMSALVRRSPEYGGIAWKELTDKAAECVITRRCTWGEEKFSSRFTIDDAVKAGLTGKDVWKRYPKRMLKHRCLSYALRDAFPDLLAGLYDPDEMDDTGEPVVRNVTPEKEYVAEAEGHEDPAVEADVQPEPAEGEPSEAYLSLMRLRDRFDLKLKGGPYKMITELLNKDGATDEEYSKMYDRTVVFLNRCGIKVA